MPYEEYIIDNAQKIFVLREDTRQLLRYEEKNLALRNRTEFLLPRIIRDGDERHDIAKVKAIAVEAEKIYLAVTTNNGNNIIFEIDLISGDEADGKIISRDDTNDLTVHGNYLFYPTTNKINTVNLTTKQKLTTSFTHNENIHGIASDADHLYYSTHNAGTKASKTIQVGTGGTQTNLILTAKVANSEALTFTVSADSNLQGNNVSVVQSGLNTVVKVPTAGASLAALIRAVNAVGNVKLRASNSNDARNPTITAIATQTLTGGAFPIDTVFKRKYASNNGVPTTTGNNIVKALGNTGKPVSSMEVNGTQLLVGFGDGEVRLYTINGTNTGTLADDTIDTTAYSTDNTDGYRTILEADADPDGYFATSDNVKISHVSTGVLHVNAEMLTCVYNVINRSRSNDEHILTLRDGAKATDPILFPCEAAGSRFPNLHRKISNNVIYYSMNGDSTFYIEVWKSY